MFQKHCKLVFICATNKLSSYQHTLSFAMRNKVSHGPITITKAFSSIEFGLQGQPDGFYHYIKTISNFFFFFISHELLGSKDINGLCNISIFKFWL